MGVSVEGQRLCAVVCLFASVIAKLYCNQVDYCVIGSVAFSDRS